MSPAGHVEVSNHLPTIVLLTGLSSILKGIRLFRVTLILALLVILILPNLTSINHSALKSVHKATLQLFRVMIKMQTYKYFHVRKSPWLPSSS